MKTILYVFAGRKENIALQLPFVRRILAAHPNVEYHIWDLSQDPDDHDYLQTITGERITVITEFYGVDWSVAFNDVFRRYAIPGFRECAFVKIDEDIVFIEDRRFGDFIAAINRYRGQIISANVLNNGGCTKHVPGLWPLFEQLGLQLKAAHLSSAYAAMCHQYMFDHWRKLVDQKVALHKCSDWLSINLIGYNWDMGRQIVGRLATSQPRGCYDCDNLPEGIRVGHTLGDEGVVNMFPRLIMHGFTACHLYFSPQRDLMTDDMITDFQKRYAEIGEQYRTEW